MFKPQRLGTVTIPDAELTTDKKNCKKIGPCGVGEKAIYLNSFYFDGWRINSVICLLIMYKVLRNLFFN